VGVVAGPANQASGIAGIGEGAGHERISGARSFQHSLAAVAVLDVGAMNPNGTGRELPSD